ncbi:hypothetical protein B0H66DRAFT_350202 [Apodospora peruviana]|uniref:Dimethylaniline monooxygenase n=1 Tax=Apodospora peruviana TaxID=516989 RepID=A0AAE0HUW8_9PEZI|nr:hypothetical protein B0H66DRAFT_350202 [Apodospora peruviana]
MKVAVIGGGPSGLVTLKYLLNAHTSLHVRPIEAKLFESEDAVGGTFYARTYEDAELVSSKQLTTFSDFRPRDDDPDFLSASRYIQYLQDYCTHFRLWPHINLSTAVQAITRDTDGKHTVTYLNKTTGERFQWECDAIAVCSGLHVTPNIPQIPGMENVPIRIHSSEFKGRAQFGENKTVMVLGSGETGADVAYMAVTAPTKRVIMCHRSGFHFAPKRNLNPTILPIFGRKPKSTNLTVPLDNARASLFDTAYVHPLLRSHSALWTFYDIYVKSILWLNTGTPGGLDQLVGEPSPEKNHVSRIFFNKSSNAGPYISAPYRRNAKRSTIDKIRSAIIQAPIKDTGDRQIDLAPWPESVSCAGVVKFNNSQRLEWERIKDESITPDIVVYCTGYRQEFAFFEVHNKVNADKEGRRRYPVAAEADVRDIWKHDDHTVGFIGFLRPSLGAIPPLSEMQAQLWIMNLAAPDYLPAALKPVAMAWRDDESHYRLVQPPGSRIRYGIDHESYVYQLALDMGSAPGAIEIIWKGLVERRGKGWRLPIVWALGANYNAKFRLRGPWKWEGATEVLETEMWTVITRRRWFFDHFLLSVLPMMIFGPVSLVVWLYATVYWLVLGVEPGRNGGSMKKEIVVNGFHYDDWSEETKKEKDGML